MKLFILFAPPIRFKLRLLRIITTQTPEDSKSFYKIGQNGFLSILQVYFTIETHDEIPTIDGGPFPSPYEFSQLHFHWGDNDSYGSEGKNV